MNHEALTVGGALETLRNDAHAFFVFILWSPSLAADYLPQCRISGERSGDDGEVCCCLLHDVAGWTLRRVNLRTSDITKALETGLDDGAWE